MAAPSVPANPALVTRRVVTARDAEGRSVIASDGPSPVNVGLISPAGEKLPLSPDMTPVER